MDSTPAQLTACPHCAAQMPATAAFCPGCGRSMLAETPRVENKVVESKLVESKPVETKPVEPEPSAPRAEAQVGALPENIAGAIAYFTFVPAILFLVFKPYNRNRFVRFHSVQCLSLWGAGILLAIALKLASVVLFLIPVLGPLLVSLVAIVIVLGLFVIWLVLEIKSFQGEMFQLPWLGDLAMQHAGGS